MTDYKLLAKQIDVLAEDEPNYIPVLSNASALLYENMEDLNWAGFYLMDKGSLLLGPFQGKVACIRIPLGKGVCGTAAGNDETQLVANVHEFAGHIACDSASNSEVVVPLHNFPGGFLLFRRQFGNPGFLCFGSVSLFLFYCEESSMNFLYEWYTC